MTPVGGFGQLQAEWLDTFTGQERCSNFLLYFFTFFRFEHTKIRCSSKARERLRIILDAARINGHKCEFFVSCHVVFYLPSLLVCRYIKVKMTKDKTPKKQLLLIYICWFYCFIPILQTHRVHSLQRVEWLISNNFKDHSWQFNTVLQFMAPCVGRMFFWKVVREFMAAGCTSATPFIS